MTSTNDPSQETSETHQSEEEDNPLNEEFDEQLPQNPEDELHGDLNELRILSDGLKNTREPSRVSLATSIQKIIDSINIAEGEITNLSQYRDRMREHYSNGMSKEAIKELDITKAQLWSKFIDPRTRQPPPVRKNRVCMDWCNYQPWIQNWRKRWFMVFDKPPCNNVEVPQYFLRKLWAEFVLGLHVNYFDITEFQGRGLGSAQDRPHAHRNPLRGPPAPRRESDPPPQPPGLGGGVEKIDQHIRRATRHLLRHASFMAMSAQSRQDQPETQASSRATGVGPETRAGAHRCSHCGHACHGPTQEEPAGGSYMEQVSYCFIKFQVFIIRYAIS
jgi:hypothetical protein